MYNIIIKDSKIKNLYLNYNIVKLFEYFINYIKYNKSKNIIIQYNNNDLFFINYFKLIKLIFNNIPLSLDYTIKFITEFIEFSNYLLLDSIFLNKIMYVIIKHDNNITYKILNNNLLIINNNKYKYTKLYNNKIVKTDNITIGSINLNPEYFLEINNNKILITELENNISLLKQYSTISYYNYKNKKTYNNTYRSSNQIINLNTNIELNIDTKYLLDKLIIYEKDDFFKPHSDLIKNDLNKTLVLFLPTYFKGGDLYFPLYDYTYNNINNVNKLNYIIFPCNYIHEVLKITEGIRIVLIYHLKYDNKIINKTNIYKTVNINYNNYYKLFDIFFKNNTNIVMGSDYKYKDILLKYFNNYSIYYSYNKKIDYLTYLFKITHEDCILIDNIKILPNIIIYDIGRSENYNTCEYNDEDWEDINLYNVYNSYYVFNEKIN